MSPMRTSRDIFQSTSPAFSSQINPLTLHPALLFLFHFHFHFHFHQSKVTMKFSTISLILLGVAQQTLAQKSPLPLSSMDKNGDGIVTMEEAKEFIDTQPDGTTIFVEDHLEEDSPKRMRRAKSKKSDKSSSPSSSPSGSPSSMPSLSIETQCADAEYVPEGYILESECEATPCPDTLTCTVSACAAGRRSSSWRRSSHRSASCTSLTTSCFRLPVPIPLRSIGGECWCSWTFFILEPITPPFRFVHIPDHILLPFACANPTTIDSL